MKSPAAASAFAFAVHPNLRGVFVGSGSDGMADPRVADAILRLVLPSKSKPSPPVQVRVAYLGTATYDLPPFCTQQTQRLVDRGCHVTSVNVALPWSTSSSSSSEEQATTAAAALETADVIVVGGGNTLFAVDRWTKLGYVLPLLRRAMERGAVLTGGSAGAICWFDGGHSDSMDPDTYLQPMLEEFRTRGGDGTAAAAVVVADESNTLGETAKEWKYIRVGGLGFLPGLVCPHHDRVQSNGILRAHDFDNMLLRHPGEVGIGIDHWAALVVEGDHYRVLSLEGKAGSVVATNQDGGAGADFRVECGVPGMWIKTVVGETDDKARVEARVCPREGKLGDILKVASEIVMDTEAVELCRRANPSG